MRVLNAGCGEDLRVGTDWIDLHPSDKRVKKIDLNDERFPYPDNTFDKVYSREVITHLPNLTHFLGECRRVLKKDGEFYVTTDSAGLYGGPVLRVFHGRFDQRHSYKVYRLHTAVTLKNTLEAAGFRRVRTMYSTKTDEMMKFSIRNATPSLLLGYVAEKLLALVSEKFKPYVIGVGYK